MDGKTQNGEQSLSPMNNSKRKADENGDMLSDCSKKKKYQLDDQLSAKADVPFITVNFSTTALARQYGDEITASISQITKADFTASVMKRNISCLEFFKTADNGSVVADEVQVLERDGHNSADVMPKYNQTFDGIIGATPEEKKNRNAARPKNTCFNCEGDHMMTQCPEPRDGARIAKNRREHQSNSLSYGRYHDEPDQRFGHLQPGRISAKLRQALGLRDRQLPAYIYRMRMLGYPPGWLQAARHQRSNIAVHHEPKSDKEAGLKKEAGTYDHSKLISYPGFNVQDKGAVDEHHRLGFPPIQFSQSLLKMKLELPTRASKPAERPGAAESCTAPQDMELDDGEIADPAAVPSPTPQDGSRSPSLEALERERRVLLQSLEEGEYIDLEPEEPESKTGDASEEEEELVHSPTPAAHSTPMTLTPGASRRQELGTPVGVPAASRLLPDAKKWAAGITEHMHTENLPGAVGAWSRMSELIKRVRQHVTGK